jgi:hypothetical protein
MWAEQCWAPEDMAGGGKEVIEWLCGETRRLFTLTPAPLLVHHTRALRLSDPCRVNRKRYLAAKSFYANA